MPTPEDNRHLCSQCRILFSSKGIRILTTQQHFTHSHLSTFESRPDCVFCSYLWNQPFTENDLDPRGDPGRHLRDVALGTSRGGRRICSDPERAIVKFWTSKDPARVWEKLYVLVVSADGSDVWRGYYALNVVASEADPCAQLTAYRPVKWHGSIAESAEALKALIADCQEHHQDCQPSGPTPLPTRLLRITKQEPFPQVNLHMAPPGKVGEYAALSYCWGGPQEIQLVTSNLEIFKRKIPFQSLPQTLKDAVITAMSLGLGYLWVDALCILQDDDADKTEEIANMCSIYKNSAVTIVASTARSADDGFLKPAPTPPIRYPSCEVEMLLDEPAGKQRGTVTLVPYHRQPTEEFSINSRGWTFQEALIPPRLLVFGDLEPFLRCRVSHATPMAPSYITYLRLHEACPKPERPLKRVEYGDGLHIMYVWPSIVEEYTLRTLSFPEKDWPLAIGGVIDFLSEAFGDECRFGVWGTQSVPCLAWIPASKGKRSDRIVQVPTWSWMSFTGSIRMRPLYGLMGLGDRPEEHEAEVEFDADPVSRRLYVTSFVLREGDVLEEDDRLQEWLDLVEEGGEDRVQEASMDGSSSTSTERCLVALTRIAYGNFLALVVERQDEDEYRRCGVMEVKNADRWLSGQKKKLVLV
ncbi:hypothetical protein ACJ41O_007519 [Fusarium nematophilum]